MIELSSLPLPAQVAKDLREEGVRLLMGALGLPSDLLGSNQ
jgi:hypothetical protein